MATDKQMVKSDLIHSLGQRFPSTPEDIIAHCTNLVFRYLSEALADGKRIELRGFGSFSIHHLPPRLNARNPRTGEKVVTTDKYRPHFKPGKLLRDRVNDSKDHQKEN